MNQKCCTTCPYVDVNEMSDERYCSIKDYEPIKLRWHKHRPDWCPRREEAIPVAWLEEQAKWFESMDNAFAKIEASNIRVMIKKWRMKKDEGSD